MNRQKFLAELAKLLSFMYEEDRLYALDMYERMFDIAEDNEQWLIQNLMSPTRQAVIIARSYDAKERKLSVSAQWKEEDGYEDESGETPPFVLAINKIFDDLFPDEEDSEEPTEEQVSFSDLGIAEEKKHKRPRIPKAAILLNQTQEFKTVQDIADQEVLPEDDSDAYWLKELYAEKENAEEPEMEPDSRINMIDRAEAFDGLENLSLPQEESEAAAELTDNPESTDQGGEPASEQAPPAADEAESPTGTEPEQTSNSHEQEKKKRSIEDLLGFWKEKKPDTIATDEKPEQTDTTSPVVPDVPTEKRPVQTVANEADVPALAEQDLPVSSSRLEPKDTADSSVKTGKADTAAEEGNEPAFGGSATKKTEQPESGKPILGAETEKGSEAKIPPVKLPDEEAPVIRKPPLRRSHAEENPVMPVLSVPRLILFLIIAIPSTLAVLAVLAFLVAFFLALSIGAIALGSVLVISAFSGFAVLADILLLLGAAIISLALGLMLLWIAFWLIGEAMVGWVQSVRELHREWCYKEVPET